MISLKVLIIRIIGVFLFLFLTTFVTNNFSADLVGKFDFTRTLITTLGMISVFGMQQSIVFYSGYLKSKGSFGELREIYFKMLILIGSISMIFLILNQVFIKEMKIDFFNENISELISKSIFALFFYSVAILNIETYRAISKLYLSEIFRSIGRYLFLLLAFYVLFKINKEPWIIEAFLLNFVLLSIMTSVPLIIWLMKIERIGTQKLITSKKIIFRSVHPLLF